MTNEKKILAQQRIIEELRQEIKNLEAENALLTKREEALVQKEGEVNQMHEEFSRVLEELHEIKNKYTDALHQVLKIKDQYSKQAKKEINRIRDQI